MNIKVVSVRINLNKLTTIPFSLSQTKYLCCNDSFHQFLLQVYSQENINQYCSLRHYTKVAYFLIQMGSLFLSTALLFLVNIVSNYLNLHLVLILCASFVLHFIVSFHIVFGSGFSSTTVSYI